jgi:Zn-dependent protease with chaperone function
MHHTTQRVGGALALLTVLAIPAFAAPKTIKVEGVLEYHKGPYLIVDGQRIEPVPGMKFKVAGAKSAGDVPLGYGVRVKGVRQPDGTVKASEFEAKANTVEGVEAQILAGTNMAESTWVAAQAIVEQGADGKMQSMGKLFTTGPRVDRARRIVDRVLPDYVDPAGVRVYVVENPEWNAMAMANFSIYVYTGIMDDLSDDELSVVLGHEIAHATYEHSRRQASKNQVSGIAGQLAAAGAGLLSNSTARTLAQQATQLGYSAFNNSYSRDYEDQADRVGLRYVYEAGYDYQAAPALWRRFAEKYGDQDGVTNFFFGDHSLSAARADALEKEIRNNYHNAADPPAKPAPAPAPKKK